MTNLKKRFLLLLTTALLMMLVIPVTAFASEDSTISAKLSNEGSNIVLEITGHQLVDLYAYEFQVAYDSEQVKFISGKSNQSGFTIEPIVKEDKVLFAHTKTGQDKGIDGSTTLATLTFEKITQVNTEFRISSIKLVDSALVLYTVNQELKVTTTGGLFTDITGHWAEATIINASELGWVSGYNDGTFRPQANITRGEFVTILVRALGLTADSSAELSFIDAQSIPAWSRDAIVSAVKAGLVEGYSDGTFQANKLVTRAEMATIIVRSQSIAKDEDAVVTFNDANDVPKWAQPYVAIAAEKGWVSGLGDNTFAPLKNATRAEATQMIINLNLK
ncbi:MAG TPA: S-layer homology domain-containing protein [Candidatus Paenibacillus intestinavium]|nr:S-layer homology domain-containing protein [Candidatus Paenibacillus intestinavium]